METTGSWLDDFGVWLVDQDKAVLTVAAYLQDARHLARWYAQQANGQQFSPVFLTKSIVRAYLAWQKACKAAVASRNRRLATLRVLCGWAREQGLISGDPCGALHRERHERTPRAKTEQEWQAILATVNTGAQLKRATTRQGWLGQRDRVIIGLLGMGLRIAEVAGLDVDDIHDDQIHVRGEGGIERDKYLSDQMLADLAALAKGRTGALIINTQGGRLTTSQIRRRVNQVGQAAGLTLKPHDLRHTRVYRELDYYLQQGLGIPTAVDAVRQSMGHADNRTTMLYLRARDSQMRAAARAL